MRYFEKVQDILLFPSFPRRSAWERTVDALRPLCYDRGTRPWEQESEVPKNEDALQQS